MRLRPPQPTWWTAIIAGQVTSWTGIACKSFGIDVSLLMPPAFVASMLLLVFGVPDLIARWRGKKFSTFEEANAHRARVAGRMALWFLSNGVTLAGYGFHRVYEESARPPSTLRTH